MQGQVVYATLRLQTRGLKLFENFIGDSILLSKIKPRHAEVFIAQRLATVPSVATVNKDIRTLRRIFNLAIEPREYLVEGQNPFAKLKERKTTPNEIRYVEVREYLGLVEKANGSWWRAFFSLAYGSGLRRNEILNLTWKNVDFEDQLITVAAKKEVENILRWDPKSRVNRIIPMSDESSHRLADLQLKATEGFPYIFISPERLNRIRERQKLGKWNPRSQIVTNLDRNFKALGCKAGLDKCVIHDLRRSAITNWAKELPIQVVQQLAGHSDISTTRKYYVAVRAEDMISASKVLNSILTKTRDD